MIAIRAPSGSRASIGAQSSYPASLTAGVPPLQYGVSSASSSLVVIKASTHPLSPAVIRTRTTLAVRPARRVRASIETGPGSGELRKWALAAITCGRSLTVAAARPSRASR